MYHNEISGISPREEILWGDFLLWTLFLCSGICMFRHSFSTEWAPVSVDKHSMVQVGSRWWCCKSAKVCNEGLNFIGILNLNLSFKNQRKSFQEKNYCNRQISTWNRGYCKLRQGVINKLDVFRYYFHCCHYSLKIITGFLADC